VVFDQNNVAYINGRSDEGAIDSFNQSLY